MDTNKPLTDAELKAELDRRMPGFTLACEMAKKDQKNTTVVFRRKDFSDLIDQNELFLLSSDYAVRMGIFLLSSPYATEEEYDDWADGRLEKTGSVLAVF